VGVQFISGLLFFFCFTACYYTPYRRNTKVYSSCVFCTPRYPHRVFRSVRRSTFRQL